MTITTQPSSTAYDKLLARVSDPLAESHNGFNHALRAVVELHTDIQTGPKNRGKSGLRARCTECGFAYPCPTIQAIQKELA